MMVTSQSSIYANFSPPLSNGGSPIYSYKVKSYILPCRSTYSLILIFLYLQLEWDTDPGVQEVQTIKTNLYLGPNEVQSITTSATVIPEVQTVGVFASKIREVQRITVSQATAGYFFVELDTSSLGGSVQYSGYIEPNYPPDSSPDGRDVASVLSAMSNIKVNGVVQVSKLTIDAVNFAYLVT
ncbi:hypothetical protein EON64_08110, partial [archaeon]